jgi:hypothetical protein
MFYKMQFGIKKPQDEPKSVDEMRRAINEAGRDSSLIRQVLATAQYQGMSGEDKYAMLAYYALLQLEEHYQANMEWLNLHPAPFGVKASVSADTVTP